jgi:hypothetical protein
MKLMDGKKRYVFKTDFTDEPFAVNEDQKKTEVDTRRITKLSDGKAPVEIKDWRDQPIPKKGTLSDWKPTNDRSNEKKQHLNSAVVGNDPRG